MACVPRGRVTETTVAKTLLKKWIRGLSIVITISPTHLFCHANEGKFIKSWIPTNHVQVLELSDPSSFHRSLVSATRPTKNYFYRSRGRSKEIRRRWCLHKKCEQQLPSELEGWVVCYTVSKIGRLNVFWGRGYLFWLNLNFYFGLHNVGKKTKYISSKIVKKER